MELLLAASCQNTTWECQPASEDPEIDLHLDLYRIKRPDHRVHVLRDIKLLPYGTVADSFLSERYLRGPASKQEPQN